MNIRWLVCLVLLPPAVSAVAKPNFVFIIADDLTYRDIGCYGGQANTPNIDRLATEGMRFSRCFQSAPMCSPTRHNIYTGLYPVKSGAYPNHTFANQGTRSVVHYLQPLGYRVALSGKTHIGPNSVFPFEYSKAKDGPDIDAIDQLFAESKQSRKAFCLFACSTEPHSPWTRGDVTRYPTDKVKLPPYFVDTPETRENFSRYLAEITYYDDQVGRILNLLRKHQLSDNTLVIVVSEQGSGFPFAKWTCYESGLQSAFIARWPGRIEAGATSDALIEYIDVLPTFIEAAGGTPDPVLQGKSLIPVLTGKMATHKRFVFGIQTSRGINHGPESYGIRSVRDQRFKYIRNLSPEVKFTNAATQHPIFQSWIAKADSGDADAADKVNRYQHRPAEELFDLDADPLEWTNLAEKPELAEVKARLSARLDQWMQAQGDLGQQTELAAHEHQRPGRKSKRRKRK